jgi:hypothetical protein
LIILISLILLRMCSVFPDRRLVSATGDRLTFSARIPESGAGSYRLQTSKRPPGASTAADRCRSPALTGPR